MATNVTEFPRRARGNQDPSIEEQVRFMLPYACLEVAVKHLTELAARWEYGIYGEDDGKELDSALSMMAMAEALADGRRPGGAS